MKLEKKIGLLGAVGIVTGGVIGMGAYVLVPGISANAGEGAWLAIMVALVVSLIGVLPLIQISSALPVAGAGYLYASRLINPLAGTLVSGWALVGGTSSLCLVSLGLAQYFLEYVPVALNPFLVAILFVAAFYLLYQFGLKLLAALQIAMALQMLVSLIAYAVIMLNANDYEIVAGAPSEGFMIAVILAFNVCFGFQIIIEMGEEIINPKRNIPLALIIGAGVIMVIYLAILSGYLSEVGAEGAKLKPKLIDTAQPYFNAFMNIFFITGVFFAGITSYNAGAIALPRELFSMARDKTLPTFFTKINAKNGNPANAVNLFFIIVIAMLTGGYLLHESGVIAPFFGTELDGLIEFYGFMTILGIMMLTIFISISAFRLPTLYAKEYQQAYIKFPVWLLRIFVMVSIISSASLIIIMSAEKIIIPIIYLGFTLLIIGLYFFRKKQLQQQGIEIGKVYDAFGE